MNAGSQATLHASAEIRKVKSCQDSGKPRGRSPSRSPDSRDRKRRKKRRHHSSSSESESRSLRKKCKGKLRVNDRKEKTFEITGQKTFEGQEKQEGQTAELFLFGLSDHHGKSPHHSVV